LIPLPLPLRSIVMDAGLLVGRIVLVLMFLFSGVIKFIDLSGTAAHIAGKGLSMPTVLAAAAGALEVIGGLMVVLGWQTRLAAVMLMVFTAVAGAIFHDFWNVPAGREQIDQMLHLWKNATICGGFLLLASAGPGRYSMDARLNA
jgi:putative oxidoreductase